MSIIKDIFAKAKEITGSETATKLLTAANKAGAAGKSMIKKHPIATVGGSMLGLAAILSEPPKMLEATMNPASPRLKSGSGGARLQMNIHPEGGSNSAPTVPNLMNSTNTARVRGPSNMQHSHRININANNAGSVDYEGLSDRMNEAFGSSNTSTVISDRRSSLTPQKLSGILENS